MKKVIVIFSIVAGVFLAAMLFSYFYVNELRVSEYLNDTLGEEYQSEIEFISFNLLSRTLRAEGITVSGINPDERMIRFDIDEISLNRIGIADLLRGKVSIGSVDLKESRIILEQKDLYKSEFFGTNLEAGPIQYDPQCNDCSIHSIIGNMNIRVDSLRSNFWNERYELKADSLYLNESQAKFGINTILIEPAYGEDAYFRSFDYRTEMFRVGISDLIFKDFDYAGFYEQGEFSIEKMSLESADIHITVDKSMKVEPDREDRRFPLEALNVLPFRVDVDSLLFRNTDIRYSEYAEDGDKPGTIHFANTEALFTNIRSKSTEPVILTATSYLEEMGEFNTHIEMSVDESGHLVKARGQLGEFDATRLNNIFVYLEGIQIKSGQIHELDFEFQLTDTYSDGYVSIRYNGLEIEKVDKIDLESGFSDRISGFLYNQVALRSSSINDGEEARKGEISHEREPERGFFNNMWRSLRSGILDTIKRI